MCFFNNKYRIIFLMAFFVSCVNDKNSAKDLIDTARDKKVDTSPTNSTVYSNSGDPYEEMVKKDSFIVNNKNFFILLKRDDQRPYESDSLIVFNARWDTLYTKAGVVYDYEFYDFNNDGHNDILIHRPSNTPSEFDVALFTAKSNRFIEVKNFYYPAAVHIKNTDFYYSYHKAGCADLNWVSELFYIENYTAISLGIIEGKGCDGPYDKREILISKIINDSATKLETLSIDTIGKFEGYKWEFIEKYWTKNYRKFVN